MKNLSLSDLSIEDDSDAHVLLGTITIAKIPFHVMLIEVEAPNSVDAVDEGQDMINGIISADGGDSYYTVPHKGRHYFVVIHPFQF